MQEHIFHRIYRQLNPQQKEAVDWVEGPLMVVAGPGTGKTQVVAMRIAQILRRTQMEPRNILALTFTEAGVITLRERVVDLVGPAGYQVSINTFHSFASEIISSFGYCFAFADELKQISEIARLKILKETIMTSSNLQRLRPPRSPAFLITKISQAIKALKQEGVTPDRLSELAVAELKELDELPKAKKLLRQAQIERNIELVEIYRQYQQNLSADGWYDYEDIINFLADGLQTNSEVRAYCQERYQYILVDEFQDSNNTQNRIVELLAGFFATPNHCVVGDDKQAIYRFQGASVANMLHFFQRYPDLKLIILKKNYRSSAAILNSAACSIAHNQHQLANFLPKVSQTKLESVSRAGPKPCLLAHTSETDQQIWLAQAIAAGQKKGLLLKDMAVLTRTNTLARQIAVSLIKSGISTNAKTTEDWLDQPIVKHMLLILNAINNPAENSIVALGLKVLTDANELPELLAVIEQAEKNKKHVVSFSSRGASKSLARHLSQILAWYKQATVEPLAKLVDEVMRYYLQHGSSISCSSYQLESLAQLIRSATTASAAGLSLDQWLEDLALARSYRVSQSQGLNADPEGVFISTVHGAKGMEFTSVFMVGLSENYWSSGKTREVIVLPKAILSLKDWQDDLLEDERRLFYVGITRARRYLYLSYAKHLSDDRETLPCQYLSEIETTLRAVSQPAKDNRSLARTSEIHQSAEILSAQELRQIRQIVKERPFSATDLIAYLACPRRYLLQRIFHFPSPPNYSLMFGNAIHRALERFSRLHRARKRLPSKRQLQELFIEALSDEPLGDNLEVALSRGRSILASYYDRYSSAWQPSVSLEYNFRAHHVVVNKIWITGRCDRIDLIDPVSRSVRVVDYKTGSRAKSVREIKGETKNSRPDLWLQLLFYAVLAKNDPFFPYKAKTFSLAFVDDQEKFPFRDFSFSNEQIREMEKLISATWQEIISRKDFPHLGKDDDPGCWLCRLLG